MKDFADVIVYIAIMAIIIVGSAWLFIWESDLPMWLKWMLLK